MKNFSIQSQRNSLDHAAMILSAHLHDPNGGMQIEAEMMIMRGAEIAHEAIHTSIAYEGNLAIGAAMLIRDYPDQPLGTPFEHLVMVFVRPESRGQGIAQKLLKSVMQHGDALKGQVFAFEGANPKSTEFWAHENIFWFCPNAQMRLTDRVSMPPHFDAGGYGESMKEMAQFNQDRALSQGFALPRSMKKR